MHLAVVATDPVGIAMLRRHPRFTVQFVAWGGTERHGPASASGASDSGSVERLALKVPEAAQAIGLSERQVRSLIASGELRSFHVGRSARVRVTDLEQYLARLVEVEAS
jgi:excisionase family DNA binding protein